MSNDTGNPSIKTLKAFGRAVIIGLGGTGQKALREIKRNFQNNCDGKVPPSIRLLAFDTDQAEEALSDVHGNPVELTANEFCRLRVNLVRAAIQSPYVQPWWISYPPINNTAITDGAGGIREMGRLALFSCIDQVKKRIETVYNEMKAYGSAERMESDGFLLLEGSEQVIVIGSLSGGTGGGTFFDVSILCRALGGATFRYMAYVMMPWVYHNVANAANENTYAGLAELNQLAELSSERPLRIRYSDTLECTLEECPYHIVNLVDGLCDNGERITSPADLAGFIGESVYHLTGALGVHARSIYDNIMTMKRGLGPTNWKGCKALYSAIGVANIRYPVPEIHRARTCELTAELLDLLRSDVVQQAAGNPEETTDDPSSAFIEQHHLKPTKDALLRQLLPDGAVKSVSLDDDELESLSTRQELVDSVEDQASRAAEKAKKAVEAARVALSTELAQKLRQLLEQNPARRGAAITAFAVGFKAFKDQLTQLSQTAEEECKVAREQKDRAESHLPAENSFFARVVGGFKSKARAFAEASNDQLQATCVTYAVREGMELIDALAAGLAKYREEKGMAQAASETLGDRLRLFAQRLRTEAAEYTPRKGMAKKRFDYVLGVDDAVGVASPYYWYLANEPVPKAEELLRELKSLQSLPPDVARAIGTETVADLQPAAVARIGIEKYVSLLSKYVGYKCRSILSHSAVAAIKANKKKAAEEGRKDPTFDLVQRALARSTLLLPLRQEELVQEPRSIRDILVIGIGSAALDEQRRAKDVEEDLRLLTDSLPDDVKEYTKVAHTEEPYRITVTRYKAIFPLHAIQGAEDLRRAYNDRVLPPTHIDRQTLFRLNDPLPQEDSHHAALKLLALALMKSFRVIEHVKERAGGSYFKPASEIEKFCLDSYDDRGKLPGKAGKFYSLVDELSRRHFDNLREGIETELRRRSSAPDFLKNFFAEAKDREEEFRAMLENVTQGLGHEVVVLPGGSGERQIKGLFNKTITGLYYRREADFFRQVYRKKDYIESKVRGGTNLIDLLLDRDEGINI